MTGRTTTTSRAGRGAGQPGSAALFAARARTARRRSRRPMLVAVAGALVLVALAVLAWSGPLLVVRSVEVEGPDGSLDPTAATQVVGAARAPLGRPLAQVDTSAVAERVRELPFVADVTVSRAWPSALRLVVTERVAVAAVPRSRGRYTLVDVDGVAFDQTAKVPAGLPVVRVDLAASGRTSLTAALEVLAQLPAQLRSAVRQIRASSPDAVRLQIGTADVVWGSADRTQRKAEIFMVLRRTKARVYDVSSPETPVTR